MFADSITKDLFYYEREQSDTKHERAADILDKIGEIKERIENREEELAVLRDDLCDLQSEYDGLFDTELPFSEHVNHYCY